MTETMLVGGGRRMRVTSWRPPPEGGGSVAVHPMITLAERVESASRHRYYQPRPRPTERDHPLLRSARKVRLLATEDDVLSEAAGSLFEGITRRRARFLRATLCGYPVRFWSCNDELYGHDPNGTLGVFATMYLEGDWVWGSPLAAPYDIVIHTSWEERDTGPACGGGVSRHMGLAVPTRIEVLSADAWDMCEQCGCWRPRRCLRDVDAWALDDPHLRDEFMERRIEFGPRLECRLTTEEGYCR